MTDKTTATNFLETFKAALAGDLDAIFSGQSLHCPDCGRTAPLATGDAKRYTFHGWPLCCGKTMKLVNHEAPDAEAD